MDPKIGAVHLWCWRMYRFIWLSS